MVRWFEGFFFFFLPAIVSGFDRKHKKKDVSLKRSRDPGSAGDSGTIIGNVLLAQSARGETGARLGRCRNPSITRQQFIASEHVDRQTGSLNADRRLLALKMTRECHEDTLVKK